MKGFYPTTTGLLILLILAHSTAYAAGKVPREQWLLTAGGLGLSLGIEMYGKDHLVPAEPRISGPGYLDRQARNQLWWGEDSQDRARTLSDILIYGVSMSSLLWGPMWSDDHETALFVNARVFTANSLLTNITKILAARERPYSEFATRPSEGAKDRTSFYSGHSSVAFSQAVANAMILSRSHPQHKALIWSGLMTTAGLTAYLRVAGDMHYFTDVLVGSLAGAAVGWIVTRQTLHQYGDAGAGPDLQLRGDQQGFVISFKLPLD